MASAYLKDPADIYRKSFAIIRREVDLSGLNPDEAAIAIRVAHACGMTDVVDDLVFGGNVADRARSAVKNGRPVFIDVEMVRAAMRSGALPGNADIRCTLNHPPTAVRAAELSTTRSAAAVHAWLPDLEGAVVIIGNAPTALFALLELMDTGAPKPAALFAFPVGFVGAAESKAELAENPRDLDFVTLAGRRGGSAMATAAFNAVLIGAQDR
ncbi:MAG: precorrin-8X methylmutase [Pseudomonadota bacterium]